jgi:hypothetical protein
MGLNSILGLLQSFGLGWVIGGSASPMHGQIKRVSPSFSLAIALPNPRSHLYAP